MISLSDRCEISQIKNLHRSSASLAKAIDRIWNSLEMKAGGTHTLLLLQSAVEELANLLALERCSFLWYFPNTQQVQLVCQWVKGNQKPVQLGYYAPETFGLTASVLEQGQLLTRFDDRAPRSFGAISRLVARFRKTKQQATAIEKGNFATLLMPVCREKADGIPAEESGMGYIACLRDRDWSSADIECLELIAQQLEIAICQTQLYEQSQKQAQREKLINQITSQTRQSLDLETILNSAIGQLLDALQVDRCLVHLVELCGENHHDNEWESKSYRSLETPKPTEILDFSKAKSTSGKCGSFWETAHRAAYRRRHLYEVHRQPFSASIDDFDTQGPITQWVIQNRQPVVISDVTKDPRIGNQNEEYQQAAIKSSLVVPVQANNVLHAILYLNQCSHNRYWSSSDRSLAEAVANQLAIAIQQACLFAQTRASMEREALLRLISDKIRSTLDLKTILQTAVKKVRSLLQTDRVAIYQFTENCQGEVVVEEAIGKCPSICEQTNENGCTIEQYIYPYQGEGIQVIDDVSSADFNDEHIKFLQQLQVRSSLVVPIVKTEESREIESTCSVWGLLIVHECHKPRMWTESEVELLQQLATQVAIAIQQAQLYEHTRKSAKAAQSKAEALEKALYDLQQTQAQLIQTEKMSSLGQLVAGVAHEINNPVNFIYGNLTYANSYSQDLLKLVNLYQKYYPESVPEIQEMAESIDLEFILEDLPKILSSMEVGADRIRQIVLSLRNFSRVDQAEMKPVDIHEGIDNTLLILQNRLKANAGRPPIVPIKDYGPLPLVECYAGQLNQVFMNLLCNAIDALEDGMREWELSGKDNDSFPCPKIWISTSMVNSNSIAIRIADNGPGIPPQVKARLFDAFFTTKPVGRGTGLGLSIGYHIIVEKHKGAIWCESEVGKGTEFCIQIPVKQQVQI